MDLSIVDLDVPFSLIFAVGATSNAYAALGVLAVITWQVLFISIPTIILAISLQVIFSSWIVLTDICMSLLRKFSIRYELMILTV